MVRMIVAGFSSWALGFLALSAEASVFFVMFAMVGVVFGFAYAWNRGSAA